MLTLYDLVGCCVVNALAAGLCCWLLGKEGNSSAAAEATPVGGTKRDGWGRGRALTW